MTAEPALPASPQRLRRNPVLLCAFHAGNMALFPIAVFTLFLRNELGLGLFHVFVLQAIFACGVALLEFPSGYLADRWGYRRVLLVATVFAVLGWLAYALAVDFVTLVIGELLLAVCGLADLGRRLGTAVRDAARAARGSYVSALVRTLPRVRQHRRRYGRAGGRVRVRALGARTIRDPGRAVRSQPRDQPRAVRAAA